MSTEQAALAEAICICTANHSPGTRVECRYAEQAAAKVVAAGWRLHEPTPESTLCWITGCWKRASQTLKNGLVVCDEHGTARTAETDEENADG